MQKFRSVRGKLNWIKMAARYQVSRHGGASGGAGGSRRLEGIGSPPGEGKAVQPMGWRAEATHGWVGPVNLSEWARTYLNRAETRGFL